MAAGDLITDDWEFEWDGLLLGGDTAFSFVESPDLADLPGVISADRERLRRHGKIAGDDFLTDRQITLVFELYGEDQAAFEVVAAELAAVTRPGEAEAPLCFRVPGVAGGGVRRVNARVRRRQVPVNGEWYYNIPVATLQFVATDPRIYSATDDVQTVNLPSGGGGLSWAATWPAVWSAQVDSGSLFVTNVGNFSAPWSATITGPVVNPQIRNVTTGQFVGFNLTLVDGDVLTIDSDSRTVILNGTESRYYTVQQGSAWWDFEPGVTEIAYRASTSTTSQLTMTTRSAWMS